MSGASAAEIQRWAMDVGEWLWGTAQGAFNAEQTTSQILVDAVVGMVPLVGDITAARDLIAVTLQLAEDPRKREEAMQWVLLVVLLFALIPVVGGVIKGVGRLLMKFAKKSAERSETLREIIEFLNRAGHGNALKWLRALDFTTYRAQIEGKFNALMNKFLEVLEAFDKKLGGLTTEKMKGVIERRTEEIKTLKALGAKMIPKALVQLNDWLREVQQAVYGGGVHNVTPGIKNVTREDEARLLEDAPRKRPRLRRGFPANTIEDYRHVEGWPDLSSYVVKSKDKPNSYPNIEAFSGVMRPVELKGGQTIFRVLLPSKNGKASPWWTVAMPQSAEEWRELLAVLDKFNVNNFFIKYTVPDGVTLKAWAGKAAEQFDSKVGQYLPGGGEQLFIEFPPSGKQEVMSLPAMSTGWGKTLKTIGYGEAASAAIAEVDMEKLAANEVSSRGVVSQKGGYR